METAAKKRDLSYILYVGGYLDEAIIAERGLPMRNAAGSNRMRRLSEAFKSAGEHVIMVSTAISMRIRWMGQLIHPPKLRRAGSIPVLTCRAAGLPVVGMLLEVPFLLAGMFSIAHRRHIAAVMIYNFSPAMLLIALFVRLFWRVPLVHHVEDVSAPKWSDWRHGSEARPIQQLVFVACMFAIIRLSDKLIIPTLRFAAVIPQNKPTIVITGCMPMQPVIAACRPNTHQHQPISVLFAGKIEFEHGIQHLLDAMHLLEQDSSLADAFEFHICGCGSKQDWVVDQLKKLRRVNCHYHGFVSDAEYRRLLAQADICFALQDPLGRYGSYKTPSKVYEYLAYGKMVIATDVGDLTILPKDVLTICEPLDGERLYQLLVQITRDPNRPRRQGIAAGRYVRAHFDYPLVGEQLRDFFQK